MAKGTAAIDVVLQELYEVAKIMNLDDRIIHFLETPQRFTAVNIPLRMDDGSMRFFRGYRSQHNCALGPCRGGTRLHQAETADDVKALSFWMSIKNALAGIPSGGGKGGIAVDPDTLSQTELERLCRGYIRGIAPVMGPDVDVFGPDVGTPQQVMAWFLDEYETLRGCHEPGAFTGKPILLGGSLGRQKATGYGLVYSAGELLRRKGISLEGKQVVIQGFGNLGANAAEAFAAQGARLTGASDKFGAIMNPHGIEVAGLIAHVRETGSVVGMSGCTAISGGDLLELPCDILVPAALQNQLTRDNADRIKARFVVEGANGPTTVEADHILSANGVTILPDILANFGGVLVSYLEHVQNRYSYYWTESEVFSRLETTMTRTCAEVCKVAEAKKIPLRSAAWVLSLDKIVTAMRLRGWIPA